MAAVHRRCKKCRNNSRLPEGKRACREHGKTHVAWTGVVDVGDDGKRQRRSIGYWTTKAEAEEAAAVLSKKNRIGLLAQRNDTTLGEWLDEWYAGPARMRTKATTHKSYGYQVTIVKNHMGDVKLQKLTLGRIQEFYVHLVSVHGLTPTTAKRYHALLHRALKVAHKRGLVDANVLADDDAFEMRLEEPQHEVWTPEQLSGFLAQAMTHRLGSALWLLTFTGARRGEVCGVQWRDIDLEAGEWHVRRAKLITGPDTPKSKAGNRTIGLDARTIEMLRAWKVRQTAELMAAGVNPRQHRDLGVFNTPGGTVPVHPDTISKLHVTVEKAAGLPHMRMHGLRHLHGSLLVQSGESLKAVSTRLGHSSAGFTLSTYIRDLPGERQQVAARFADLVPDIKRVEGA